MPDPEMHSRGPRPKWPAALTIAAALAFAVGAFAGCASGAGGDAAVDGGAAALEPSAEPALRFVDGDAAVRVLPIGELRASCGARTVEVDDPYYGARKRYLACPIDRVLELGFGRPADILQREQFLLRALDGYTKPASGQVLFSPGGFIAFADGDLTPADASDGALAFAPIDRRGLDPAPFYMVWSGLAAGEAHSRPWPYQLGTIERSSGEAAFPFAAPDGLPKTDPAWRGFELFFNDCVACHAINGEGGRVGPDLNVPMSIVEYRPVDQIKAYILDPQSFRYTTMPPHPHLTDADLDALIAYFRAMSERKHAPESGPAHGTTKEPAS